MLSCSAKDFNLITISICLCVYHALFLDFCSSQFVVLRRRAAGFFGSFFRGTRNVSRTGHVRLELFYFLVSHSLAFHCSTHSAYGTMRLLYLALWPSSKTSSLLLVHIGFCFLSWVIEAEPAWKINNYTKHFDRKLTARFGKSHQRGKPSSDINFQAFLKYRQPSL